MTFFWQLLPSFIEGLKITLSYWSITLVISFLFSLPCTYLRLCQVPFIRSIMKFYIYLMRGTPLLLQLMFFYFGLPYMGIVLSRESAALIAFVLNYTAYFTEILRGGVNAIDIGQSEVAQLLGFSKPYTFFHLLLPQALKNSIPSFINEALTLLKDTCLVSVLGMDELLRYAKIAAGTYATGIPFVYVGMIYLILNIPIAKGLGFIEKKLNYYR